MRTEDQPGTIPLGELYAPIADDLARARRILADELISDQGAISDLCHHVGHFHGKMLRPALLLLVARACGDVRPAHHTLAAVMELVHVATLVHDDLLDEADIRRRAATVNRLWGTERAVLMGDFLYSHAYHLCAGLDSRAARLVGQAAITVCEGEMMQVANRGNFALGEGEYLDIITRKTATLIEACCHLGALYADADENTIAAVRTYGRHVGIAFQIVDDLLDLVGDESEVGKSLGRDISEGELTLPLIHCLRAVEADERAALLSIIQSNGRSSCRQIAARLRCTDSISYALDTARQHIAGAQEALAILPTSAARDRLQVMAEFVLARRQ